jgi:putative endonuclease
MLNWLLSSSINKTENTPKTLGQLGEEFAQEVYRRRGYNVIAANFFNKKGKRKGEIDFIATEKDKIVFVEVKTRARDYGRFGTPQDSVDNLKQIKLLKAVKIFLLQNPKFAEYKPQIDVCVVLIKDQEWLIPAEANPAKYFLKDGVDKYAFSAKIMVNAVEDWG